MDSNKSLITNGPNYQFDGLCITFIFVHVSFYKCIINSIKWFNAISFIFHVRLWAPSRVGFFSYSQSQEPHYWVLYQMSYICYLYSFKQFYEIDLKISDKETDSKKLTCAHSQQENLDYFSANIYSVSSLWTVLDNAGFLNLSTADIWAGFFGGAVLCIVGCLAASLASTHKMPLVTPASFANQKYLQIL